MMTIKGRKFSQAHFGLGGHEAEAEVAIRTVK